MVRNQQFQETKAAMKFLYFPSVNTEQFCLVLFSFLNWYWSAVKMLNANKTQP